VKAATYARTRRTRFLAGALLVPLTCAGLLWSQRPPEKPLLERARRIGYAEDWNRWGPDFDWLTDKYWLHFRYIPSNNTEVALRYDSERHEDVPLTGLNRRTQGTFSTKRSLFSVSPDGKSLLWTDAEWGRINCATIDGERHREFPRGRFSTLSWCGDSRHIVEYVVVETKVYGERYGYVLLHDTRGDSPPRRLTLPADLPAINPWSAVVTGSDELLWFENKDTPSDVFPKETPTLTMYRASLRRKGHPYWKQVIRLPFPARCSGGTFSRDGRRVLLELYRVSSLSRVTDALNRWVPSLHLSEPLTITHYYVCNTDGSDMHEIGSFVGEYLGGPEEFRWSVDGKRIGFVYNNWLWTVPAD
jgi:hypothetical protein